MRVTVEFAPEIQMPNRRIGQAIGKETILECMITAFPHAVNYWEKDGRRITSSTKHRIEAYDEGDHTITLSLRVHNIEREDYGEYKCVAANALGRDTEIMHLYRFERPKPGGGKGHSGHRPSQSSTPRVIVEFPTKSTPAPNKPHKPYKPEKPDEKYNTITDPKIATSGRVTSGSKDGSHPNNLVLLSVTVFSCLYMIQKSMNV